MQSYLELAWEEFHRLKASLEEIEQGQATRLTDHETVEDIIADAEYYEEDIAKLDELHRGLLQSQPKASNEKERLGIEKLIREVEAFYNGENSVSQQTNAHVEALPGPAKNTAGQEETASGKLRVTVPCSAFAGRSGEAAREALRKDGFAEEVIAFILVHQMGFGIAKTGRLLKGHDYRDEKTYHRHATDLLRKAESLEIILA